MRYLPPLLGHIPRRIDDLRNPLLHGFPVNVSFPRIDWAEGVDEHEIDIQSYRLTYDTFWPDPDSAVAFRVCSGRFLAMGYYNKSGGDHWVRVIHYIDARRWRAILYKGNVIERGFQGNDLDLVMWHTTFGGLNYDRLQRDKVEELGARDIT